MDDETYYFCGNIGNDRVLCISSLTDREAAAAGQDETSGYFLYERRVSSETEDVTVLARVPSEDAAFTLSRLLNLE